MANSNYPWIRKLSRHEENGRDVTVSFSALEENTKKEHAWKFSIIPLLFELVAKAFLGW